MVTVCALALPALADKGTDAGELAFWQSIAHSQNPAEYQAYLQAYPNGTFAGLAKLRAGGAALTAAPPVVQKVPAAHAAPKARVTVQSAQVRFIDGIVVDVDASGLWRGSNWRLAVMPIASPDAIAEKDDFALTSTPISARRMHLTEACACGQARLRDRHHLRPVRRPGGQR